MLSIVFWREKVRELPVSPLTLCWTMFVNLAQFGKLTGFTASDQQGRRSAGTENLKLRTGWGCVCVCVCVCDPATTSASLKQTKKNPTIGSLLAVIQWRRVYSDSVILWIVTVTRLTCPYQNCNKRIKEAAEGLQLDHKYFFNHFWHHCDGPLEIQLCGKLQHHNRHNMFDKDCCPRAGRKVVSEQLDKARCYSVGAFMGGGLWLHLPDRS